MPLIYVIQQARNKLKFLVQPANDMYIYNTSLKFYYNYLKTCKFFTFAIWYGTVGWHKLWKTYETVFLFVCKGYRFCLFLRFWYLILELFQQFLVFVFHFKSIIIFNWNSRLAVKDDILYVQWFLSDVWLQITSKMFHFI
jgi:hypothetical protein